MKNLISRLALVLGLINFVASAAVAQAPPYPQVPGQPTADASMAPPGSPYIPATPPPGGNPGPSYNPAPYSPSPYGAAVPGSAMPPYSAPQYTPAPGQPTASPAAYDSPYSPPPSYAPPPNATAAPAGPGYPSGPYASSPYGPPSYSPAPGGGPAYSPAPGGPPPYTPAPYESVPSTPPSYTGPPSYTPAPQTYTPPIERIPHEELEGPRWLFAADAMFLERSIGSSVPLGFTVYNPIGPQALPTDSLSSDDEQMPLEAGTRLQLGRRLTDDIAVDATYWGLQQWNVGRMIFGDPFGDTVLAFSPWTQTDALIGGFNNFLGYTYKSEVNNLEINERIMLSQRDPYHSLAWLWGFRYFQLGDNFTLSGDDLDTGDFENINWKTDNELLGLQAGLQWTRGWDRFQIVTEGKAGIFANFYNQKGNNLDSSGVTLGQPAGFVPFDVTHSGTDVAALFDLSLLARYRLNQWLWLRLGYQAYLATGLALAPRQLGGFSHGGTVAFDGPSVGLEATW